MHGGTAIKLDGKPDSEGMTRCQKVSIRQPDYPPPKSRGADITSA